MRIEPSISSEAANRPGEGDLRGFKGAFQGNLRECLGHFKGEFKGEC